jgi:hypothetical protein
MIRVDKYFIEELNKNGFDIDFKTLTGIYRESRNNSIVIKKRKRKELPKGGCFKWVEEELEWVEISREEYERLRKLEENDNR